MRPLVDDFVIQILEQKLLQKFKILPDSRRSKTQKYTETFHNISVFYGHHTEQQLITFILKIWLSTKKNGMLLCSGCARR